MQPLPLVDGVHRVGVLNPDLRVFDVIMRTARDTTYNAYLVRGQKTALIETVRHGFAEEHLGRIRALVDPTEIDYVVVNHTEPDHSGALGRVLERAPHATVVC